MERAFLPGDYTIPKSGGKYMKFEQGDNQFRILESPIVGWVQWTETPDGTKSPIRTRTEDGVPDVPNLKDSPKHFWAMPVWNYKTGQVEVLEITQSTIQSVIKELADDPDWGSPLGYDINIKKTGEKLETKYTVMAKPAKELDPEIGEEWMSTNVKLEALYDGGDPFEA